MEQKPINEVSVKDPALRPRAEKQGMSETEEARSLLDQLLTDSRLYTQTKDYKELLDFVVKLRNFAPFNVMLLHIQKPGLRFAASALDWRERFGRWPRDGARPLLILWPFGPVALVYDVQDTEGKDLPQDVESFYARGPILQEQIGSFVQLMSRKCIECRMVDLGDASAGSIRVVKRAAIAKEHTLYRMLINRNHPPAVQFATMAHELGHLFLGHLGPDKPLEIPERSIGDDAQIELEAESVSFLICKRNGVESKSETYLKAYVKENTKIDQIDVYQVMRAAGQSEALLGLIEHMKFDRPIRPRRR